MIRSNKVQIKSPLFSYQVDFVDHQVDIIVIWRHAYSIFVMDNFNSNNQLYELRHGTCVLDMLVYFHQYL